MPRKHYSENMYNYLKRCGFAEKYEHPGIYCIKLGDEIVYIGKSKNMLERVSQHYVGIKTCSECKYRVMSAVQNLGYTITFDVMYYASSVGQENIENEIGSMEGEYIRKYRPKLNTQIPKADDWHRFDTVRINEKELIQIFAKRKETQNDYL